MYPRKNWPEKSSNVHSKFMRATESFFFYLDLPSDLIVTILTLSSLFWPFHHYFDLTFTILTLPLLFWPYLHYSDLAFILFWLFLEWHSVHQHRLLCQTVWCGCVWQVHQGWCLSLWPILHLEWQHLCRSLSSQETSVRVNIFQCQYVVVWAFANQIEAYVLC